MCSTLINRRGLRFLYLFFFGGLPPTHEPEPEYAQGEAFDVLYFDQVGGASFSCSFSFLEDCHRRMSRSRSLRLGRRSMCSTLIR
jgi:hypothetical protein